MKYIYQQKNHKIRVKTPSIHYECLVHQELAACTLAWICRGVWEKLAWSLWRCGEILLGQAIVLTLFEYPLSFNLWNYSLSANALHFIFGIMTNYKTNKKLIVVTSKSKKLMLFIKDWKWRNKKTHFFHIFNFQRFHSFSSHFQTVWARMLRLAAKES